MYHCVSSGLVTGGDHRAGHARPAGLARLRDVINSWLEETELPDSPDRFRYGPS